MRILGEVLLFAMALSFGWQDKPTRPSECGDSAICITKDGVKEGGTWDIRGIAVDYENHRIYGVSDCSKKIDVPGIEWRGVPIDVPPIPTDSRSGTIYYYTCEDKSRFLMTSEDGKKHCLKLP